VGHLAIQKTKPIQTQFKPNSKPILAQKLGWQSQFKAKQTQFQAKRKSHLSRRSFSEDGNKTNFLAE